MKTLQSTVRTRSLVSKRNNGNSPSQSAGKRKDLRGLLYVMPAMILYTLVVIVPFFAASGLAFVDYNVLRGASKFVGLENFSQVIFRHEPFMRSLGNSLLFVVVIVAFQITLGFIAAVVLANKFTGCSTFRTLIFLPWVVPGTITAITWKLLYDSSLGPLHALLNALGMAGTGSLLASPDTAMPAVMAMQLWSGLPLSIMILMAGVQSVPHELHESAKIDGCGLLGRTFHVTLPFMSTTFFVCMVLTSIWTFKAFEIVYLTTRGGPAFSTLLVGVLVYQTSFEFFQLSVGSAMGLVMLAILVGPVLFYTRTVFAQRNG